MMSVDVEGRGIRLVKGSDEEGREMKRRVKRRGRWMSQCEER